LKLITRLSKREKSFLWLAIIAVVCIALYILVLEPTWNKWQQLNKTIDVTERKLLKNLKIMGQKEIIDELYDKYAQSLRMKGSVEEETAVILSEIENIARQSNVIITDIKPQSVKDMDFYKEYYVEMEAEGNIASLAKFIYELQNSKQILKVRHLRLNAKETRGDTLKGYMVVTKILIP